VITKSEASGKLNTLGAESRKLENLIATIN
jgi:hypothetical protein